MTDKTDLPIINDPRRRDLWLVLPFLWQVGGVPIANAVPWRPLGMPFLMAWQMVGILVSSATIWRLYRADHGGDAR